MQVVKVWCEWDVGAQNDIYATEDLAYLHMREALKDCDIDDPIDLLIEKGLVSFETVKVIDTVA